MGLSLDKADKDVLGLAAKVVLTKDATTIVGDGTTQEEVLKRVSQIRNLIEVTIKKMIEYLSTLVNPAGYQKKYVYVGCFLGRGAGVREGEAE